MCVYQLHVVQSLVLQPITAHGLVLFGLFLRIGFGDIYDIVLADLFSCFRFNR